MSQSSEEMGGSGSAIRSNWWTKVVVALVVVAVAGLLYVNFGDDLSLDSIADRESQLRSYRLEQPGKTYALAFLVYVIVTGLST